jgi:hypothetical protein
MPVIPCRNACHILRACFEFGTYSNVEYSIICVEFQSLNSEGTQRGTHAEADLSNYKFCST